MRKEQLYSDEQLVSYAQNGNLTAYNTLLQRHTSTVRQIISVNLIDQSNVNDLAQEVLLKVYRYLPTFKLDSQFSTWMYRITHNTIKNHYRTTHLRMESESQFAIDQVNTMSESPEHQAINIEFNEKMEEALNKLSDDLRTCYGLHIFEGQTYENIAREMKCPIGTVRSRISRARKLLSDSMDGF